MPQVEVMIGGRSFEVSCQPGEEPFLRAAAEVLDGEASTLSAQIGRMPEARMLLMSGLMLADKAVGLEERLREAEARVEELSERLASQARLGVPVEVPVEVRVEVPVIPAEVTQLMADHALEAEALARQVVALVPDQEPPAAA